MNKEKQQIEEMAKVIASVPPIEFPIGSRMQGRHIYTTTKIAEHLYTAGYIKQSEGEWIEERYIDEKRSDFKCSVCEFDDTFYRNLIHRFYKYCPNCGSENERRW